MVVVNGIEELMSNLGSFGKYQFLQFMIYNFGALNGGLHLVSLAMVAGTPDHRCKIPGEENQNITDEFLMAHIPIKSHGSFDNCLLLDELNKTFKCNEWIYNTTYFSSSIIIENNFVCDDKWKGDLPQSIYMIGSLFGAYILGVLSDRKGRRLTFCLTSIFLLFFSVGAAFTSSNYPLFLTVRFFYGVFGSTACLLLGYVAVIELTQGFARATCGIIISIFFSLGIIDAAIIGYFIEDHIKIQIYIGLHSLLVVISVCLLDESPRWLWWQGRWDDAAKIVQKALKFNGSSIKIDGVTGFEEVSLYEEERIGISSLGQYPVVLERIIIMALLFFSNSFVYYGFTLNTDHLPGNPHFLIGLSGLVEIPSYILTIFLIESAGRRNSAVFTMLGVGSCGVTSTFIEEGSILRSVLVTVGKFFIAISFTTVYIYVGELFPTTIRSSVVGLCVVSARLGGAAAPLVPLLAVIDDRVPMYLYCGTIILIIIPLITLPETLNRQLPHSLEECEAMRKNNCFGLIWCIK